MRLYHINKQALNPLLSRSFALEKDMQVLIEHNLDMLFGLEFIATEVQVGKFRIDTLAFNPETKSFVIIEYKRGHSYSVIDQAMTYLALLLNHKADFTQQLSEYKNIVITKKDIDWSQSRIIIVAESFNTYQKESIHFKDLPLELFECKRFQGDCIVINPVISHYATESIKQITTGQTDEFELITKELKTYTEEEHMQVCDAPIVKIYEEIKEFILDLDDEIVFEPKKMYISCRKNGEIYFDLKLGKSYIKIFFNIKQGALRESRLLRDISKIGHHGNGDYEMKIDDHSLLFDAKEYLKQTYKILSHQ